MTLADIRHVAKRCQWSLEFTHQVLTPGCTDQEKKREIERAGQKPHDSYDKDQASNPEGRERQDSQFDPSHI